MPQRRAAVKATANLKDADKPMTKKEEELVLFGEPENKKKKDTKKPKTKKGSAQTPAQNNPFMRKWKKMFRHESKLHGLNTSSTSADGRESLVNHFKIYLLYLIRKCIAKYMPCILFIAPTIYLAYFFASHFILHN